MENNIEKQVKSRKRVRDHGEVFTSDREVNAMLDLVKPETERIDSRFLEPACGNGNFMAKILERKLAVVESQYKKSQLEYERYAVLAVSSIYGIDILQDNVEECRMRLFEIFNTTYTRLYRVACKEECRRSVKYILSVNVLWGDALTLKTPDATAKPIVFPEWSAINGSLMKRKDFTMANLMESQPMEGSNLFSDLGDEAFLPTPVADYPLVHFLKIGEP
jgi:hypothetical protein